MAVTPVGIVGTGSLARFLVEGHEFAHPGSGRNFVLSPRGAAVASDIADRFGSAIAASNQTVVDGCSLVIVAVLPQQAADVLAELRFSAGQTVVSVMAAVGIDEMRRLVAPATVVTAMMPGLANAIGRGPTVVYPSNEVVRTFFAPLGPVLAMPDWHAYTAASTFGGLSGTSFSLLAEWIGWYTANGVPAELARELVSTMMIGNAEVVRAGRGSLEQTLPLVATPGGITEQGRKLLDERGALRAWSDMLSAIARRMRAAR